jgi:hypothetical protein
MESMNFPADITWTHPQGGMFILTRHGLRPVNRE